MRAKQIGLIALALCILAPPVLAQAPVVRRVTGVDAEYNALITGFNQDLQKWHEPLEKAKNDEDRQKIQLVLHSYRVAPETARASKNVPDPTPIGAFVMVCWNGFTV